MKIIQFLILLIVIWTCQVSKKQETIKKEISDLEVKITRLDFNDSFLSDMIYIYGEIEILPNFDSIQISLDTTNPKIEEEWHNEPKQREVWKYYKSHFRNYTDSVYELVSVRNFELINKKRSYGSLTDAYDPTSTEDYRLLKKGVYKKYFFRTHYPQDNVEFDSVSFGIDYKKNGKKLRKSIGKQR